MPMPPALRKAALAVHITVSVGWVGAVAAYIALDVTVATSQNPQLLRSAYVAMGAITSSVIVPLAFATLITGLVSSLGTSWGLFRHYWVVISLIMTALATLGLLSATGRIDSFASVAANPGTSSAQILSIGNTLLHSVGGTVVLLVTLALNVFKPRGLTRYGHRKQQQRLRAQTSRRKPVASPTATT